jgi:hypothetical protein
LAAHKFVQLFDAAAWDLVVRALVEREVVRRDGRLGRYLTTAVYRSSCHLLGAAAAHKCVELFDAAAQDGRHGGDN